MRPIDADALLNTHRMEQSTIGKDWGVDDLAAAIEVAPTVDAAPVVHGKFLKTPAGVGYFITCSVCGGDISDTYDYAKYCYECGAKLDGVEENNKHGTWEPLGHRIGFMKHPWTEDFRCSLCGYVAYVVLGKPPKCCPRCFAQMDGGESDGKDD